MTSDLITAEHVKKDFMTYQDENESDINVRLAYIDNVWIRQMHFPKKGDKNVPHLHNRDHASLLARGSAKLTVNGKENIYTAPAMILVHKDYKHQFEALEDDTLIYCVHGIRDKDGNIIDREMIPNGTAPELISTYGENFVSFKKSTEESGYIVPDTAI